MDALHLHLALNHVPVFGALFVSLLLLTALCKKDEGLKRLGLWWALALTLISIPIKFTGDYAEKAAHSQPWLIESYAEIHEQAADQATTVIFLMGTVALLALILARKGKTVPQWAFALTLLLGIATFALMVRTAYLGGLIRHAEIRPNLVLNP